MGGNVSLHGEDATRIDLTKINRTNTVSKLLQSLAKINEAYKKKFKMEMWSKQAFNSLAFLSGSAKHFFDLHSHKDDKFVAVKPTVGDIDTMVPLDQADLILAFLDSIYKKTFGDLTFIGYKKSNGQYITLWKSKSLGYNIQVDLELVEFANGLPTTWSSFSHSSHWTDMSQKIKGVFQKYALRALSTKNIRPILLLKGKKKTPTVVTSTDIAFSPNGARYKLKPVLDEFGHIVKTDGLETFEETTPQDTGYVTDLDVMFEMFFGRFPTKDDLDKFGSFIGVVDLVKHTWSPDHQKNFIMGFANTLWGQASQKMYRGNAGDDLKEKTAAFEYLLGQLTVNYDEATVNDWKTKFYAAY